MLSIALLLVGVAGSVVAPQVLSHRNKGISIPRRNNQGIALFYVAYGVSVAAAIIGALLLPSGRVIVLLVLAIILPLPLQLTTRFHNAGLQGKERHR